MPILDQLAQDIFQCLKKGTPCYPVIPLDECAISPDGLLIVYTLLYVPDKPELYYRILKSCHKHPAACYPRYSITYELVSRDYW